ncbi:GntR family transcriptional regulator [Sphingomonas sanguinis]|uniref:GntR family transcriptional regulator n=1 Tax=Sphingomonas sanguinis TaxID=33051 RepID=A0ABU5LN21_9SPHN|nr:GntR family transcriptional regulator [Sphingomonas sanguinis]MDZ7281338.1 GntR family transcriptional regulator [Sphingomonas sanguinis]
MNAGATTERVHDAVRRMILTRRLRPGARLDPAMLADRLATSVTPVREALNQLCGAGLVDARPGGGFHVPLIDAPALADLYRWNDEVIGIIVRSAGGRLAVDTREQVHAGDIAVATAALAERLARASGNEEHLRAMRDINARLHAVRVVEGNLIADTDQELARLAVAAERGAVAALRTGWRHYHRRRQRLAPEIVRALLRD